MNQTAFHVRFGPVTVAILAHEDLAPVHRALEVWLAAGLCDPETPPDVSFELLPARSRAGEGTGAKVLAGQGSLEERIFEFWDGRAWEASTEPDRKAGDGPRSERGSEWSAVGHWKYRLRDGALLRTVGRLPTSLFRLLHVHRFSPDEVRASTFLYRHLIAAVQTHLLKRNATFVHASAVGTPSGRGMLLSGWGGSGKTSGSASLYLGHPERWRFMSDDLAVVDAEGTIHFSPVPLNVFPYSTARFEPLHERVVRPMGIFDRLQWTARQALLGERAVARRIPPWRPPPTGTTCSLELCVHLQRGGGDDPVIRPCDPTAITRICGNVLLYELRHSLSMYTTANAFLTEQDPPVPPIDTLAREAERVIGKALRGSRTFSVTVPESHNPAELGEVLSHIWAECGVSD